MLTSSPPDGLSIANAMPKVRSLTIKHESSQKGTYKSLERISSFAPTVHSSSLRILLFLAASKGDEVIIEQADIKNAYLNALLDKNKVIYSALPPCYELFHTVPSDLSKQGQKVILQL